MVTKNAGDWFEESLASLANQDYEQLSILVVDNGSIDDPAERVADVSPGAFVKRLKADNGFSAAANEALRSVEGAPFLLFCHDDVRLAPDTVTNLVAEAFRANAGIVGPKLVNWNDSAVLESVGLGVDSYGAATSLVDPGELDQAQHDTEREIFAVSDACMLVRSDLFADIGGFNERVPFFGEDVDLCWRTHIAGATVQFCPRAVVGHRGDFDQRRPTDVRDRLELRHEARATLVNYQLRSLLKVIPTGIVLSIVEWVALLALGRFRKAADVMATWGWGLIHVPEIIGARRSLSGTRRVPDASFKPLMRRGSKRLRDLTRLSDGENRMSAATRAGRMKLRGLSTISQPSRLAMGVAIAAVVIMVLGARGVIFGAIPSMREFTSAGDSAGAWISEWWTGWRRPGLGEAAVPPGIVGAMGWIGGLLFGEVGGARRLLIILPLLLGPLGAWRLFAATGSFRTRAATLAAYGLSPIALNAFSEARLQALVAYAAAPWVLRRIALSADLQPIAGEGSASRTGLPQLAGTALILAVVFAISPLAAAVVGVGCLLILIGPITSGQRRGGFRAAGQLVGSWLLAAVVSAPWIYEGIRRGDVATFTGLWESGIEIPSAAEMLTGSLGSIDTGLLGWGLVVAAAVPLFTAGSARFGWAFGGWIAIAGSLLVAILAARSDFVGGAGVAALLIPLTLGLAVSIGMAPLAFEVDVVSNDFGYRQILSFLGIGALIVGLLPVLASSFGGRWFLPEGDFARSLELVDSSNDSRALWIGDSDVLPVSGWALEGAPGINFGLSHGLAPEMMQRFRLDGGAGVAALEDSLTTAIEGRTTGLGELLAPMSVRYVVVVDRPAPGPFAGRESRAAQEIGSSLSEQLDLSLIPTGLGVQLYEVNGVWPSTTNLSDLDLARAGSGDIADQLSQSLSDPAAVFGPGFKTKYSADIPGQIEVAQSVTADPGWSMSVAGNESEKNGLFGWSQRFASGDGGSAELTWSPPITFRAMQAAQILVIMWLVWTVFRRGNIPTPRRRRVVAAGDPIVVVEDSGQDLADWDSRGGVGDDGGSRS